ncbi:MAG: type II CRISPR-associated endonuclease Cas1 [Desulfarculaceae bacterium]|jgi:CRISPR-associated protein Cas1
MLPNSVEIAGDNRHLCKERGFLAVYAKNERLGRLPLDDLGVLLVAGHGITYSNDLVVALAERCVPMFLCNRRMLPVGLFWSLQGHHLSSRRVQAQASLKPALRKRMWQQIVKTKIKLQAQVVELRGGEPRHLLNYSKRVGSGDPQNMEGAAARCYWGQAFGPDFRRRRDKSGINSLLNYAYTIVRAATARAVMLAGLHPAFSIFHRNARNPMPLVDDLMEPYRPLADLTVLGLVQNGVAELDKNAKESLCGIPSLDIEQGSEVRIVAESLKSCASSLAEVCLGNKRTLALPDSLRLETKEKSGS